MANILAEFLIKLGVDFKHEAFAKQLEHSGEAVKKFAEKAHDFFHEATGVSVLSLGAIAASIAEATERYEKLYFAAQRTGLAVSTIRSLEFASRQVGVSVEAADSAMENFALTMKMNPFLAGAFGIDPRGTPIDMVKRLTQSGMPGFMQARIAQQFGMDPSTFFQYQRNLENITEQQERFNRLQKEMGLGSDETAKQFHEFGEATYELLSVFGLLSESWAIKFLPNLKEIVGWFERLAQGKGPTAEFVKSWGDWFAKWAPGGKLFNLEGDKANQWGDVPASVISGGGMIEHPSLWQGATPEQAEKRGQVIKGKLRDWTNDLWLWMKQQGGGALDPLNPAFTTSPTREGASGSWQQGSTIQNFHTTINVEGSGSAYDTASIISNEFNRVYSDLTRYGKPVLAT